VVVKSLTQVVPACDEQHARNCYATSQQLGMAIVTSCLKEHAEVGLSVQVGCRGAGVPYWCGCGATKGPEHAEVGQLADSLQAPWRAQLSVHAQQLQGR
jgi:hypothetical protein